MIHDDELDGYPAPVDPRHGPTDWRRGVLVLMRWGLVAGCLYLFGWSFPHAYYFAREAARQAQCVNNLKQIQLAIEYYHDKYGAFPPAYVADARGRRLHSWRALILPFLDLGPPPSVDYDFSEPWDGPHNIRLLDHMPAVFRCPDQNPLLIGATSYAAITGPGTMFPGSASVRRSEIKDELVGTLSVVEVANLPIPWTAPLDLDVRTMSFEINFPIQSAIGSRHPGGANVAMADSFVQFLKDGLSPLVLRARITIDGGELVVAEDSPKAWRSR